jgi:hypothetical protein
VGLAVCQGASHCQWLQKADRPPPMSAKNLPANCPPPALIKCWKILGRTNGKSFLKIPISAFFSPSCLAERLQELLHIEKICAIK